MSTTSAGTAVGNPVRRVALSRMLRSNVVASVLVVWTVAVLTVAGVALIHQTGTNRPFHQAGVGPRVVGQSVAQWWILSIVIGILLVVPAVTAVTMAGNREQALLDSWRVSLVTNRQVFLGNATAILSFVLLALVVALPPAGLALAAGGSSISQIFVGLAAAAACAVVITSVSIAVACASHRISRTLIVIYLFLALVLGGSAVFHGVRSTGDQSSRADAVLIVNPVVAAADASATRAASVPGAAASTAPLAHLRATVRPMNSGIPPWARTLIGGAVVALIAYLVALLRLRRAGRRL